MLKKKIKDLMQETPIFLWTKPVPSVPFNFDTILVDNGNFYLHFVTVKSAQHVTGATSIKVLMLFPCDTDQMKRCSHLFHIFYFTSSSHLNLFVCFLLSEFLLLFLSWRSGRLASLASLSHQRAQKSSNGRLSHSSR